MNKNAAKFGLFLLFVMLATSKSKKDPGRQNLETLLEGAAFLV